MNSTGTDLTFYSCNEKMTPSIYLPPCMPFFSISEDKNDDVKCLYCMNEKQFCGFCLLTPLCG